MTLQDLLGPEDDPVVPQYVMFHSFYGVTALSLKLIGTKNRGRNEPPAVVPTAARAGGVKEGGTASNKVAVVCQQEGWLPCIEAARAEVKERDQQIELPAPPPDVAEDSSGSSLEVPPNVA